MNILILIAYIAYVGAFGHTNDQTCAADEPRVYQLIPPEETKRARREFEAKYNMTRIDVDEAERLALKTVFQNIENAYTNYQIAAISDAMANVSNRIDRVQNQLFRDLHSGLFHFFMEYFIHGTRRRKFDTSADFERFLVVHMKMAIFLGECYCRRSDYFDAIPMLIEANAFNVLKTCIDRFHKEGRREFEEIAQKSLDMWITHIESEQGFTRRYAHWIYDDTVSLIGIGRGRTRERAISGARGSAELLIRYGYTPKWLDEFK